MRRKKKKFQPGDQVIVSAEQWRIDLRGSRIQRPHPVRQYEAIMNGETFIVKSVFRSIFGDDLYELEHKHGDHATNVPGELLSAWHGREIEPEHMTTHKPGDKIF